VVLHALVTEACDGMTIERIARTCERDPSDPAELREIETVIEILLDDGLAHRKDDRSDNDVVQRRYAPTRAAVRANELTF
jgi:hypothetical protein